jgi:pimeloyl-ACP methyl ester carboxylesterase
METATLDRVTLQYEAIGSGEPIVFIHGALIADSFHPMLDASRLADRYRCITYDRRGYGPSTRATNPTAIQEHAADCAALLQYLDVPRAHVVGHSFGGVIALSLAINTPHVVHTLTLLEPALVLGANGPSYRNAIAANRARFRAGDAEGTVDEFLRSRFDSNYRDALERVLPGAFAQAIANAATAFEIDMPAAADFEFGEADAHGITQPALLVLGAYSEALWPRFGETHRLLNSWLPNVESYVLPHAAHGLQLQNPADIVTALDAFFRRHPM